MTGWRPSSRRDSWRALLAGAGLLLVAMGARATVTIYGTVSKVEDQQVFLAVGTLSSLVDTVIMDVPGADLGDPSKPVTGKTAIGNTSIRFIVFARGAQMGTPPVTPNFELTADSLTQPLSGPGGAIIPMSEIEWTSFAGDIGSGRFDDSTNQLLLSAPADRLVVDFLRFRYRNSTVPAAGEYNGSVTFTLSIP